MLTTKTSHFLAKFRLGVPTPTKERIKRNHRYDQNQRKLTIKTNETAAPRNDQNQHQTRTKNVGKRNHRTRRPTKPTPNANQRQGQTKPPRTWNNQRRRRRKRPNRIQPQAMGPCRKNSLVLTRAHRGYMQHSRSISGRIGFGPFQVIGKMGRSPPLPPMSRGIRGAASASILYFFRTARVNSSGDTAVYSVMLENGNVVWRKGKLALRRSRRIQIRY